MPPTGEVPIATYSETLLQVRREFALFLDRVEVRAHWRLGRTVRTSVPLSQLSLRTTESFVRNRWSKRSLVVGSLAVSAAVVLGRPEQQPWVQTASLVGWIVAALSAALFWVTFRKIRFVRILRPDGKPGLDVAQAGTESARCDEFVAAVKRQILKQT